LNTGEMVCIRIEKKTATNQRTCEDVKEDERRSGKKWRSIVRSIPTFTSQ